MYRHILSATSAFLLLAGISAVQVPTASGDVVADLDRQFVQRALEYMTFEREMAQLARERAASGQVRALARHIHEEHGRMGEEIRNATEGMDVGTSEPIDQDLAATLERLRMVEGPAFDQAYIHAGAQNHMRHYNLVARMAAQAQDEDLRRVAEAMKDDLAEHLDTAQALRRELYPIVQGPVGVVPEQQEAPTSAIPQRTDPPYSDTAEGAEP
ncbi:MAG TPA: DUF4142 domain-containing protein [Arenibaculum sp.]|nr:DUF4142 domain-containing protein [Arenibaculum sp.]